MAPVAACVKCFGSGTIEYTKEDGGPKCPHCGGNGWLTPELLARYIGNILDYPSVYMGGPSHASLMKAKKIVEFLQAERIIPNESDLNQSKKQGDH